jgi:hypothetical protein
MQIWISLLFFLVFPVSTLGQGAPPVGQWREHLPWNNAIAVSIAGDQVFCATPFAAFVYDIADNSFIRRSKVNGLSDIGIAAMCHDPVSGVAVIAYNNNNIDVWKGDRIVNIPDIRISTAGGDKRIRRITIRSGVAYLSTGLGIILIDLEKFLVKDTWRIGSGGMETAVNGVAFTPTAVYAATAEGTRTASLASDPADHRNWQMVVLPVGRADQVVASGNRVFVQMGDDVFLSSGGSFEPYYRGAGLKGIDTAAQGLLVSESFQGSGKLARLVP